MGYPEERLQLVARLRKLAGAQGLPAALRLDGQALRFHLGTSLADLRVPVALDEALPTALGAAVRDLAFLLVLRHRGALRPDEYDRFLLMDGFDPQKSRPPSFGPPPTVARAGVSVAFIEAPELHPALDSGTLASWIGVGRPGRTLVGLLHALLRRAVEEERETEGREPTPYIAALALRQAFPETVSVALRQVPLAAPAGRAVQGAIAAGLLVALRLAAREAGALDSPSGARTCAALTPLLWLSGGRLLPASALQAYGVALVEPVPRLDALVERIDRTGNTDEAHAEAVAMAEPDGELHAQAARAVAHAQMRRELLALNRTAETGRAPSLHVEGMSAAQLYGQPLALERTLASPERRKELAARLKEVARAASRGNDRARIGDLARMVTEYREDEPERCLPRGEPERTFGNALTALAVDTFFEKLCGKAQSQLQWRSGEEREGGIAEERERGRLYYLSASGPVLTARARTPRMGHLFCDVKDFTRRTAFLKEAVVSDFLSREFYTPILTAAAKHHGGASHLGDRGGIYLNNLLGDAVSFAGDVVSLVELAGEIRSALQSYSRRLESEASSDAVARAILRIEDRFAEPLKSLAAAAQVARTAAEVAPTRPDLRRKADELARELHRIEEERDADLALARGETLEAGIFLSYGAAPEVATFDDAVFGPIKVAIAEKINESVRGTARNAGVRARIEALVAGARSSRNRADIASPFAVCIAQPLTIKVTPAEESDVRACLARGERNVAEGVLMDSVRRCLDDLETRAGPGVEGAGDIYNGGAALSEEALEAYLAARGKDAMYLRRDLAVAQLPAPLQTRFVFTMGRLKLVAGISHTTRGLDELFAYVGRALFKGLEKAGGLPVWEMVSPQSLFFSLVAQHLAPSWLAEEERAAEPDQWAASGQ